MEDFHWCSWDVRDELEVTKSLERHFKEDSKNTIYQNKFIFLAVKPAISTIMSLILPFISPGSHPPLGNYSEGHKLGILNSHPISQLFAGSNF